MMKVHRLSVLCSGMVLLMVAGGTATAGAMLEPVFDPANFTDPTTIDNP